MLKAATEHYQQPRKIAQVRLDADLMIEPSKLSSSVQLLDALPEEEAEFYAAESNLLVRAGISQIIQQELEDRYAFLGGSMDQWTKYHLPCRTAGNSSMQASALAWVVWGADASRVKAQRTAS